MEEQPTSEQRARFIATAWGEVNKPTRFFQPIPIGHKAKLTVGETNAIVAALVAEKRLEKTDDGRVRFTDGGEYAMSVIRDMEQHKAGFSGSIPESDRQARFIVAAYQANPTDSGSIDVVKIGATFGMNPIESMELAHILNDARYITFNIGTAAFGRLTLRGRERARELLAARKLAADQREREEKIRAEERATAKAEAKRKERNARLKWPLVYLAGIASPLIVDYLKTHYVNKPANTPAAVNAPAPVATQPGK